MRVALILYVGWTVATFLLEGWPRTLLRPEAVEARVVYALVANVLIGTVLAGLTLRRVVRQLPVTAASAGFGPPCGRSPLSPPGSRSARRSTLCRMALPCPRW